ncbi:MAG: PAS domain-containing protein [Deltaproteobacteria bacterium]|jgi:PAS domain S-box-containing protein|nr:PAS domain-containing protein [Deltaproteobacteria bacterium]
MVGSGDNKNQKKLTLEGLANNFFLSGLGLWELELCPDNVDSAEITVSDSFLLLLGNKDDDLSNNTMGLKEYIDNWVHPEELGQFLEALDDLTQGVNDHYELEHRLWCYKREEWRWINLNCEIINKKERETGGSMKISGVIQDIHVKRLARQALNRALQEKEVTSKALALEQKRVSAVIDAANLGTWDCDLTTGEVVYSLSWAQTMGYELPELGKTLKDRSKFVVAQDLEKANKALEDHLSGRIPFYEADYRMIHKDGSIVWTQDRGRVVEFDSDHKPTRLVGVMLDVTRQKATEEALKQNTEQMELFFEAASFGTWDWDLLLGTIKYNHIFYDLLGYKPGELKETIAEWEELVHPEDLPAATAALEMCLSGDVTVYACEMRMKHKDGHFIWTYDIGRVVNWDEEGHPLRVVGGHFDFSDKKKMEQDIFKMIEQEREARLARELAEESARAKSEFLANMSHEIRTPMNAILGLTHLVLETELNEQQNEYLHRISVAAKSLLRIINDILDFSKIEAGKLEMEMAVFDLDILASADLKLHSNQAALKGLYLKLDIDPDVPRYLLGDQVRLGQILNNLLSNAIKFTETGGITVKVKLKERSEKEALLLFSVIDTGIGLSEEQLKGLFSAFTQADTSITRKYGGTGLGLTISKRLAELMGGRIWCESEPGKGSNFSFTAKLKMSDKPPETQDRSGISFEGLEVLAVDDNITALELIKEALNKQGVKKVTTVSSGDEGIQYLKTIKKKPDLIMVDWKMPGIDGIETVKQINDIAQVVNSSLIVMVTAYNRDEILTRAKELGVKKVLTKPLTESYLHDCLMDLFGTAKKVSDKGKKAKGEEIKAIKGAKILLVEDNEVNQLVASKILSNAGLNVTIASDGQKAVDFVQKDQYDLVLMDIQMPVMDGLTAAKTIRSLGFDALPIVAMTAHAMSSDRELSFQAGMNDHVNKPINVKELFQTLSKWIPPKNNEAEADIGAAS